MKDQSNPGQGQGAPTGGLDQNQVPPNDMNEKTNNKKNLATLILVCINTVLLLVILVLIAIYLCVCLRNKREVPVSKGLIHKSKLSYAIYDCAAVATDACPCSVIGKDLLKKGGSVVDAAIGAMLCVGLFNAHSAGIGGGSFMTIYNATTGESVFIDSREVAPLKANESMYTGDENLSSTGGLAIAVPGEIAGYWEAHKRFGKLQWKNLFEPSITLASEGFEVNAALGNATKKMNETKGKNKTLYDPDYNLEPVLTNADGSLKIQGNKMTRTQLASTLRQIADEGGETFYNGTLAKRVVQDIQSAAGHESVITEEDLNAYRVRFTTLKNCTIGDLTVLTPGLPSGGPVLCYILNILKGYNFSENSISDNDAKVLTYHRILEAFKFAYAEKTGLGDENSDKNITDLVKKLLSDTHAEETRLKINNALTQNDAYYEPIYDPSAVDTGTSHLSIVGEDGSAISMTSTINNYFGSSVRGFRTGIIFNNQMRDFSLGVGPNTIKPGKRPLSSMSPTIVINAEEQRSKAVKLVVGASGGGKITTATALTIMNNLWFGKPIDEAVSIKRLHHELFSSEIEFEPDFDKCVIDGLERKNHSWKFYEPPGSIVQAIERYSNGTLGAVSDKRKGGCPDGY